MCWKCFKKLELATEHEKSLSKLVKELTCTTANTSATAQGNVSVLEITQKKRKSEFVPLYDEEPVKKSTHLECLTRLEEREEGYEDCASDLNNIEGEEECVNNYAVEEEDVKVNDFDTVEGGEIEQEKQEEKNELLYVGKCYNKYGDFLKDLNAYCQETFTDITTDRSFINKGAEGTELECDFPYRKISFGCKLKKKQQSTSKGIRNRTSSDYSCTWCVNLVLSAKTKRYTIKRFSPEHVNHTNSYSSYWSDYELTEEEQKQYLDDYHLGLKMTLVDVKRKLQTDTKKIFTPTQLKNWLKWRHPSHM